MVNEWAVGETKPLYDRFGNNYEVTLIDRAMKAQNIITILKDNFLENLGRDDLVSNRGSSRDYFKGVMEELRSDVAAVSPLCPNPARDKISYTDSFADLWDDLGQEKIIKMIEHKMQLFKGSRMILP